MRSLPRAAWLRVIGLACAISLTSTACGGFSLGDLLDSLGGSTPEPEAPAVPTVPPSTTPPSTTPPSTTAPPTTTPATTVPPSTEPDPAAPSTSIPAPSPVPGPGDMTDPGMPVAPDDMGGVGGGPPPPAPVGGALTPAQTTAASSTMKIVATGCDANGARAGSGFVVGDQLVATNAHVVAGSDQQFIVLDGDLDGALEADLVAIDPVRDLALLEVPGLDRPPLVIDSADVGENVDGLGYPGDALLVEPSPGVVSERGPGLFADIYGQGSFERDTIVLSGDVDPGDSGSALVDDAGQVVGVVFGVAIDQAGNELDIILGIGDVELATVLQAPRSPDTPSGACV